MAIIMKPVSLRLVLIAAFGLQAAVAHSDAPVRRDIKMQGFLRSRSVSYVAPPQSSRFYRYKIIMLVPEGKRVEKDEPIAEFEADGGSKWESEVKNQSLTTKVEQQTNLQTATNELKDMETKIADDEKQLDLLKVGQVSKISSEVDTTWLMSNREKLTTDLDIESRKLRLRLAGEKLQRKRQLLSAMERMQAKTAERYASELEAFSSTKDVIQKAPAAGVVTYLRDWRREKPRLGSLAYRGRNVVAIVDERDLFVNCYLKEEGFSQTKPGDVVRVRILGSREVIVSGTIKSISPIAMLVSDFETNLPEDHAMADQRAFKVEVVLSEIPSEAKPEGEVEVVLPAAVSGQGGD